ncbi:MAG: rRNA pseudouridine synthase [Bacteroidetes bacterium]|nr:rRNA pseudouridine synthase [Bacteroidota bacterium]
MNKYLSECGIASRRKSEELILQGRVSVNGYPVIDLATQIDPDKDIVQLDGEKIKSAKKLYFLLHKPKGVITSTMDEKNRKTVVDLINTREKIFPVGRLDYNTTGVLLLTNDGEFTNFITHPRNKIPREYYATLNKPLEEDDKNQLLKAIYLDGKKGKFNELTFTSTSNHKHVRVVTVEGRNHFVKNMFSALGYFVSKLERKSFGPFDVKDIPAGAYRPLTEKEIKSFYKKYA